MTPPTNGRYLDNVEPATGHVYSQCSDSDEADVNRAVDAAEKAFHGWSHTPAVERSRILLRIADLIETNLDRLAAAESVDTGKPIAFARGVDIPRAALNFRFFGTSILHLRSEFHATDDIAINYTLRKPRGVVGIISPWNLPLYLFSWKVAPAMAVGNTVIGKPSELTPATASLLAELCIEAGLPSGVLNVLHGRGATVGAALVQHPKVETISFTGGTATGEQIARFAASKFKRIALEMGGKNPNIIFADADVDEAARESVRSSFANQGQICLCGSRIFVEQSVCERFTDRFIAVTRSLRIGDPMEPTTEQGAVVSSAHREKVLRYIELARGDGGRILCGGGPPTAVNERCRDGYFIEPTVIAGLDPNCRVNQEEIFGPVVTITPFCTEDEVIQYANSTRYGLSASVWTQNVARAHRVAERIACGTVWVNCWLVRDLRVPFGGTKSSGVGREGGEEAIRFFTEPKNVCIRVPGDPPEK